MIAVFSVQEEVGCRGARVASFAMEPDVGIALDVTAWGDTPEVKQPAIRLGEGIAVKVMDRASISNPALRDELLALAAEDAAVLSWHGLAPADRASDTALRRAAAFWPERLAARRLMEARLYALACDSL